MSPNKCKCLVHTATLLPGEHSLHTQFCLGYWSGAQVVLRFDQILFTVKSEHELAKTP